MATGTIEKVTNNSSSGYCKMPDGTLIQYGKFTVNLPANNWYEYTLTYPLTDGNGFNAVPSFAASCTIWSNPSEFSVIRRTEFQDSGTLRIGNSGSSAVSGVIVTWIAVGRWK